MITFLIILILGPFAFAAGYYGVDYVYRLFNRRPHEVETLKSGFTLVKESREQVDGIERFIAVTKPKVIHVWFRQFGSDNEGDIVVTFHGPFDLREKFSDEYVFTYLGEL